MFLGTRSAIRAMRQGTGGVIINIASASGLKASPGASAYCASKAAVRMFAKSAALECAQRGDGICINTIFPSGVMTPLGQAMPFWEEMQRMAGSAEATYQTLAQAVPLKRFAMPIVGKLYTLQHRGAIREFLILERPSHIRSFHPTALSD